MGAAGAAPHGDSSSVVSSSSGTHTIILRVELPSLFSHPNLSPPLSTSAASPSDPLAHHVVRSLEEPLPGHALQSLQACPSLSSTRPPGPSLSSTRSSDLSSSLTGLSPSHGLSPPTTTASAVPTATSVAPHSPAATTAVAGSDSITAPQHHVPNEDLATSTRGEPVLLDITESLIDLPLPGAVVVAGGPREQSPRDFISGDTRPGLLGVLQREAHVRSVVNLLQTQRPFTDRDISGIARIAGMYTHALELNWEDSVELHHNGWALMCTAGEAAAHAIVRRRFLMRAWVDERRKLCFGGWSQKGRAIPRRMVPTWCGGALSAPRDPHRVPCAEDVPCASDRVVANRAADADAREAQEMVAALAAGRTGFALDPSSAKGTTGISRRQPCESAVFGAPYDGKVREPSGECGSVAKVFPEAPPCGQGNCERCGCHSPANASHASMSVHASGDVEGVDVEPCASAPRDAPHAHAPDVAAPTDITATISDLISFDDPACAGTTSPPSACAAPAWTATDYALALGDPTPCLAPAGPADRVLAHDDQSAHQADTAAAVTTHGDASSAAEIVAQSTPCPSPIPSPFARAALAPPSHRTGQ